MAEETVRATGREFGRWIVLLALLVVCLVAYFVYSPRVPTAVRPTLESEAP
jgi:hypothetical protein